MLNILIAHVDKTMLRLGLQITLLAMMIMLRIVDRQGEPKQFPSQLDLNRVSIVGTSCNTREHQWSTEEEIDQAYDLILCRIHESSCTRVWNASTWEALKSPMLESHTLWLPNQLSTDTCTNATSKWEAVHAVKTFSIKLPPVLCLQVH